MIRLARATAQAAGCVLLFVYAPVCAAAESPAAPTVPLSIRWLNGAAAPGGKSVVEVAGLDAAELRRLRDATWSVARWQEALSVFAGQPGTAADGRVPPMLGTYRVGPESVRFEPQFPLEPGVAYRAVLRPERLSDRPAGSGSPAMAEFQLPARVAGPATLVTDVFPSAAVLPANLLKFYLHFSAAMSGGNIYRHIHLRDDAGRDIELPFLELGEELWDPAMTRLTLLLDPGRIKRGVRPLEEVGGVFEVGRGYTLIIDREWLDANGQPLRESFRRSFKIGPSDRDSPDPSAWKIQPPASATRAPLAISFPEPMERALAQRLIWVIDATGAAIEGSTALAEQERRWTFTPAAPWLGGTYRVVTATRIEDLAGNNIGKTFDVDLTGSAPRSLASETVALPFTVR